MLSFNWSEFLFYAEHDRVLGFESKFRYGTAVGAVTKQKERSVRRMFHCSNGSCAGRVSQTVKTHQVQCVTPTNNIRKYTREHGNIKLRVSGPST